MPEETIPPSPPTPTDDAIRRLERRIEALEYAAQSENRWWRGGLIAALVLVALSILILAHHRHHHRPPPRPPMAGMMGPGWQGRMMPYGPPPPYWGWGPGRPPGPEYWGPPEWWHRRDWNGPAPETHQGPKQ